MTATPNFSVEKDLSVSDVNCESLQVAGDLTVGGNVTAASFTTVPTVVLSTGATLAPTVAQSGTTFLIAPAAAGGSQAITLPAAVAGLNYKFVITASVTAADTYTVVLTNAVDRMFGSVLSSLD